jgi:hypothetical protein
VQAHGEAPTFHPVAWDQKLVKSYGLWALQTIESGEADPDRLHVSDDGARESAPLPVRAEPEPLLLAGPLDEPARSKLSDADVDVIKSAAFEQGRAAGLAAAQAAQEAEMAHDKALLRNLAQSLNELIEHPDSLHEPLKRLAIHLAKELVRGELSISGQAIDRLIRRCLSEIDHAGKPVVVLLNPGDRQRLREREHALEALLKVEEHERISSGSVEVRVGDAIVQDLIETRLQSLARAVLADPQSWVDASSWRPGSSAPSPDTGGDANVHWVERVEEAAETLEQAGAGEWKDRPSKASG